MKKILILTGLLFLLFNIIGKAQNIYTVEPYESYVGSQMGKFLLTLAGLQSAISSIDSGVVYIAYPGLLDTTGLGAIPSNVYLNGWYQGQLMRSSIFEFGSSTFVQPLDTLEVTNDANIGGNLEVGGMIQLTDESDVFNHGMNIITGITNYANRLTLETFDAAIRSWLWTERATSTMGFGIYSLGSIRTSGNFYSAGNAYAGGTLISDSSVYFYGGFGDIDGNGQIQNTDLIYVVGYLNEDSTLTKAQLMQADIDGDGKVSRSDYQMLIAFNGLSMSSPTLIALKDSMMRQVNGDEGTIAYNDFNVVQDLTVDGVFSYGNYNFANTPVTPGFIPKTDGAGNVTWQSDLGSGSDTSHLSLISQIIDLQDSLNTFLHLKDSTLYVTQYDIANIVTDTVHYNLIERILLLQDSLNAKYNRAEFDLPANLHQDSLDVKMNRSEMSGYELADATIMKEGENISLLNNNSGFIDDSTHSVNLNDIDGIPDTTGIITGYVMKKQADGSIAWEADATGGSPALLGDIGNVTEIGLIDNDLLTYVTDHWENQTLTEAGIQSAGTYLIPSDSTSQRAYSNALYSAGADTLHKVLFENIFGIIDSIGNAINDSSLEASVQSGMPMAHNGSWNEYAPATVLDSLLSYWATGTPSNTTYLRGDGTWSTPSTGSVDSLHYVEFNKVTGLQDTVDALHTEIQTIVDNGDVRVPFMWAFLALDTLSNDPDIADSVDVPVNTVIASNLTAVGGNDVGKVYSISSMEYRINTNGVWGSWFNNNSSSPRYVKDIDSIQVRDTSSVNNSTETLHLIYVGGQVDTFSIITIALSADTIPSFTFTDATGVALNSWNDGYAVVGNCDSARFYPASGDTLKDGALGTYGVSPIWIQNGDTVYTPLVASGTNSTSTHSIIYAGNSTYVDTFTVTTVASGASTEILTATAENAQPPWSYHSWIASSGTKWDAIASSDTTNIYVTATFSKQGFVITNTSTASGKTIDSVSVRGMYKSDNATGDDISLAIIDESDGTINTASDIYGITTSYVEYSKTWTTNPFQGDIAWTSGAVDSLSIATSSRNGTGNWYCDKLWLLVYFQP